MITQRDVEELEKTFATKSDLKEALTELKSDLFDKIDPILKEVTASREERVIVAHRLSKLEEAKAN